MYTEHFPSQMTIFSHDNTSNNPDYCEEIHRIVMVF